MPQKTGDAPPESTGELRVQVAKQGVDIAVTTLARSQSPGLINVDSAARLAAACGTAIDTLAGRRAFRERRRASESPCPDRSSW